MTKINKRKLHHYWRQFRLVKPRYFLLAAVIMLGIGVLALRANNQHMVKLRDQLYTADKADSNVQQALNNLQAYVTAHMNTSLTTGNTSVYPPIQLEYTYERLVEARGVQLQTTNGNLYTQAQEYCQKLDPVDFSGHNRVPCIEQYVKAHGINLPDIQPSLYQFDFLSPKWSPDLAGWSLVAAAGLGLTAVIKFIIDRRLKRLLT